MLMYTTPFSHKTHHLYTSKSIHRLGTWAKGLDVAGACCLQVAGRPEEIHCGRLRGGEREKRKGAAERRWTGAWWREPGSSKLRVATKGSKETN